MKKDGKKNKEREVACNIHLGNVHSSWIPRN